MTENLDQYRDWDAAYVLGALSTDDRRVFERHLANCPACTTAVAELAGMPGILSTLSSDHAVTLVDAPDDSRLRDDHHEPDLVRKLAVAATARRRRTRQRMLGLMLSAAAVLTAGGIFVGTALAPALNPGAALPASEPSGTMLAMAQVEPGTISANLQLTEKKWGTRFDWTCDYVSGDWSNGQQDVAATYSMVITDAAGTETVIATWSAAGSRAADLAASSDVVTSDIRSVEIRSAANDRTLVRTEL